MDNRHSFRILDDRISREPLAQVVREEDVDLFNVLRWTVFAMIDAEALGVTSGVHSPTFVLHHRYRGRLPIEHYDLYRLEGLAWVDTGLDEPAPEAVTVIEWPERAAVLDDWATTRIRLTAPGPTRRRLTFIRGPERIRAVFEHAPRD